MSFNPSLQFNAFVIHLHARHEARLPASHGDLTQAAFYAVIDATAPELAQALHDHDQRKPYTLSRLRGEPAARQDGTLYLPAGWEGEFRLTLLHASLFKAFMQHLLDNPNLNIRLGQANFAISQVYGAPGSHPWCGYTTAETLAAQAGQKRQIHLHVASPASFNLKEKADSDQPRLQVLPDAELIWSGLRSNWQRFAGQTIPIEFENWVKRNVVIADVQRWETAALRYKRRPLIGGRGNVTFEALHDDPEMLRIWNLLADFAFYAGLGRKTAIGMGQCRRLTDERVT